MSRPAPRRARLVALVTAAITTALGASLIGAPAVATGGSNTASTDVGALAAELAAATGGAARVDGRLGSADRIGADAGRTLGRAPGVRADASPEQAARGFLRTYGRLVGVADEARELRTAKVTTRHGRSNVRLRQTIGSVPVLGGELVVETTRAGEVASVTGETTAHRPADLTARIGAAQAARTAASVVAKRVLAPAKGAKAAKSKQPKLSTSRPQLWVYDPALLGAPDISAAKLVWRVEVTGAGANELVLIDAHRGAVALHFDQRAHAKDRRVCDNNNDRTLPEACTDDRTPARAEGGAAHAAADVNQAYDYLGDTYDFYAGAAGWETKGLTGALARDSYDNAGAPVRATVRYCTPEASNPAATQPCPYPNAYWNGSQFVFGAGFAKGDDVVAHEYTHAVTQHTSGLVYLYQSGAINESLSDVMGELVDLGNGKGTDTAAVAYKIGEDIAGGAIRDMRTPGLFGQPDSMTSALYDPDAMLEDNGGVHTNSGVGNKAAALLMAGGTFNGSTVTALSSQKVAHLYMKVQDLLTSGSDYADLYVALQQACSSLVGTATAGFVAADCVEVKDAVTATRMNLQPSKGANAPATSCPSGSTRGASMFSDNFEHDGAPSPNWTVGTAAGLTARWYNPQNSHPYTGFDATYANSGRYHLWGDDPEVRSDSWVARTGDVVPQGGSVQTYLRFASSWIFDSAPSVNQYFDGGVLEYSINGGTSWVDAGGLAATRGYNGTLVATGDNPLRGRKAFVGTSNGYTASRIDLSSLAGKSVRFRFRTGTDSEFGHLGWVVDDVEVYTCSFGPTTLQAAAAPTTSVYGNPVRISGRLLKAGTTTAGVGGQVVRLQYRAPGTTTWLHKARVTSATTGTLGAFAYTWKPPRTYEYRYVFVAANGWGASISPTRRNVVVPLITATVSPTSVALGRSASITGSVAPNHAGKRVYLRQLVGRTWRDIGSRALSTSSTYAFTVRPTARGYAYYRVAFLGDADHGATSTTNRVLRVT